MVGTGLTEVRLDRWREGGLGQQRDDVGGCATTSVTIRDNCIDRKLWRALMNAYVNE